MWCLLRLLFVPGGGGYYPFVPGIVDHVRLQLEQKVYSAWKKEAVLQVFFIFDYTVFSQVTDVLISQHFSCPSDV